MNDNRTGILKANAKLTEIQRDVHHVASLPTAVQAIADKVQNGLSMSAEQSASLAVLLGSLRLTDVASYQEAKREDMAASFDEDSGHLSSGVVDKKLQKALHRLSKLVNERPQTVFSDEAELIIEDLECLVVDYMQAESDHQNTNSMKKRKALYGDWDELDEGKECQEHFKRVKRVLNGSNSVSLNEAGSYSGSFSIAPTDIYIPVQRFKPGNGVHFTNKVYAKQTGAGTLILKARSAKHGFITLSDLAAANEVNKSFDMSLSYLPKSSKKAHVAMLLSQQEVEEGCVLRSPMLCVSALLPEESEVFRVIENGDLQRLQRMLWTREASLNDRDISGRCLLNVSIKSDNLLFVCTRFG